MAGAMPVERSAQLILLLYLGKRGRPKVRIHGRPRSDRKRRFLLSAVAPSTSARHPRKAKPINWAQRGGLASEGKLSPDAEATFHRASCTLGNQVIGASDGPPFRQESRPTRVCRTPGAGSGLLAEASTLRAGTANIPPWRTLARRTGLFRARYRGRAPGCGTVIRRSKCGSMFRWEPMHSKATPRRPWMGGGGSTPGGSRHRPPNSFTGAA